eukprot:CAMPEP_0119137236 /NCGR_PEP_ID=MMETSP1310-20130426/23215_1 /TAXON_ID=464262 /ORGANISM="Genus nov. species nov., Strain RCC2339" /LENGTH=140 /DNA_ID=CAMNT_0007128303 /DNA_START=114 /DNA_END=533 /DNA_ORIENTATION=+
MKKVWDAVTDPLIGRYSDQMQTPLGRRKPLVVLSSIPLTLYWLLMFLNQPVAPMWKFLYFLFVLLTYGNFHTLQVVPYRAMIPEVAATYNSRSSLAAYMHGIGMVAVAVGVTLMGYLTEHFEDGYFFGALLVAPGILLPR